MFGISSEEAAAMRRMEETPDNASVMQIAYLAVGALKNHSSGGSMELNILKDEIHLKVQTNPLVESTHVSPRVPESLPTNRV